MPAKERGLLYAFIIPKWQLYDDFVAVLRGRIGDNPFPRPRGGELALFLGGKLAFFTLAFAIPLLFHPLWQVALVYACVAGVQGLSLSIVFQLAHSNEESSSFSADEPYPGGWHPFSTRSPAPFSAAP